MRAVRILAALVMVVTAAGGAAAQGSFHSGLKIKGALIYNRSSLDAEEHELVDAKSGWGAGLEIVGRHFGLGLTGFTAGQVSEFSADSTAFTVLAELNYYLPIDMLRLAPYVGIHSGLGTFTSEYFDEPFFPTFNDASVDAVGYQVGLRFQPIALGSIDLQWRRLAASAVAAQDSRFEPTQILLGVTLF